MYSDRMVFIIAEEKGSIFLIHGHGKGKTTLSLGLLLRWVEMGKNVGIIQFMKGYQYSECSFIGKLKGVSLFQTGTPLFVKKGSPSRIDINEAERGLLIAKDLIKDPGYDMLILDEINVAADYGLICAKEVVSIIQKRISPVTVVLTGRNPPEIFFAIADITIEMQEVKHPFTGGILARKGIDF